MSRKRKPICIDLTGVPTAKKSKIEKVLKLVDELVNDHKLDHKDSENLVHNVVSKLKYFDYKRKVFNVDQLVDKPIIPFIVICKMHTIDIKTYVDIPKLTNDKAIIMFKYCNNIHKFIEHASAAQIYALLCKKVTRKRFQCTINGVRVWYHPLFYTSKFFHKAMYQEKIELVYSMVQLCTKYDIPNTILGPVKPMWIIPQGYKTKQFILPYLNTKTNSRKKYNETAIFINLANMMDGDFDWPRKLNKIRGAVFKARKYCAKYRSDNATQVDNKPIFKSVKELLTHRIQKNLNRLHVERKDKKKKDQNKWKQYFRDLNNDVPSLIFDYLY